MPTQPLEDGADRRTQLAADRTIFAAERTYSACIPLTEDWLLLSIGLYLVTGACWVPVVWLQVRMHYLAQAALAAGTALPDRYHRYARCWFWLGWPAFSAVLAIFYLMVFKNF